MPYAKKGMRRRRYRRRPKGAYALAKAAYAKASKAQSKKEVKFVETTAINDSTPDTTGAIQSLCVLSQGDGNNNREGNVIYPTSLAFRGTISMASAATDTFVRIIIFRWKSATPTDITELLQTTTVDSFKADSERYLSNILYDRTFVLNDAKSTSLFFQKRMKLKGMIAYDEATSTPNRNGLFIATLSNEATNVPTCDMVARLYFKDS